MPSARRPAQAQETCSQVFERRARDRLRPLLIAPVALAFGRHGLCFTASVRAEGPANIVLRIREVALFVAPDVTFVSFVRLDEFPASVRGVRGALGRDRAASRWSAPSPAIRTCREDHAPSHRPQMSSGRLFLDRVASQQWGTRPVVWTIRKETIVYSEDASGRRQLRPRAHCLQARPGVDISVEFSSRQSVSCDSEECGRRRQSKQSRVRALPEMPVASHWCKPGRKRLPRPCSASSFVPVESSWRSPAAPSGDAPHVSSPIPESSPAA